MHRTLIVLNIATLLAPTLARADAPEARKVDVVIKCHEGKFTKDDSIGQALRDINDPGGRVYAWHGWYNHESPDPEGGMVYVEKPFVVVNAFMYDAENGTPHTCLTVQSVESRQARPQATRPQPR